MRRRLLQAARTPLGGALIRLGFTSMSFAIPVKRLSETSTLLAFHHPSPSYAVHILIIPKRDYQSLMDVPADDGDFQHDLFETVQALVRKFGLETSGYRLVVNGGAYQDVPILHFHLISEGASGSEPAIFNEAQRMEE
jgi:histidine triad (HIT) family protein